MSHIITVVGFNGSFPGGNKGRMRSKYYLKPKNLTQSPFQCNESVKTKDDTKEYVKTNSPNDIAKNNSQSPSVILQYVFDPNENVYQIGRSNDDSNDIILRGTRFENEKLQFERENVEKGEAVEGTNQNNIGCIQISRFACRIVVQEKEGEESTARVFAGGFDTYGQMAITANNRGGLTWETENGIDAFTCNGILLLHPKGKFVEGTQEIGIWNLVSIRGQIYYAGDYRSGNRKMKIELSNESNLLVDGSLIDVCGATLLYRSLEGISMGPTQEDLNSMIFSLNHDDPKPVSAFSKNPLNFNTSQTDGEKFPYVFLKCGHVDDYQEEGSKREDKYLCKICNESGEIAPLQIGLEPTIWVDRDKPSHYFIPCGHMTSEKTARYWANIPFPQGTTGFIGKCPFCYKHLEEKGYNKMIFTYNTIN